MSNRIYSLEEARVGARPRTREVEVPRLPRYPSDPSWCGQRVVLRVRDRQIDFYLAGSMAAALGVTRDTLLRLERRGIVPATEFLVPGAWPGRGHARVYPRAQVLRTAAWVDEHGLLGKRLSYRADEVRDALTNIANEEARRLRAPLPSTSPTSASA